MPRYRTTKPVSRYDSSTIPLLWFVQADDEQRKTAEEALNEIVAQLVSKVLDLKPKQIVGIPWMRNYTPSLNDVFDTTRGFEMGEGHLLAMDAQSLEDHTLLVLHCRNEKEPKIGRTTPEVAIRVFLDKRQHYRYTLAELFGEHRWTRVEIPAKCPQPAIEDENIRYTLPAHIPSGAKLREDNITLFSLIKLSDKEVEALKQDMGGNSEDITIYNWPHEIPASQSETFNMFQCLKPDLVAPCTQTFVMFIDTAHIAGPKQAPIVVTACESRPDQRGNRESYSVKEGMTYQHIYMKASKAKDVRELWPFIWHPPNRGTVNDVVVNYPLFYGLHHRFVDPTSTQALDFDSIIWEYLETFIARPDAPICAGGVSRPAFVVYILCPVTPEELRILRNVVHGENRDPVQFLELDLVPRTDGHDDSQIPDGRMDALLEYFDSPAYRAIADPPSTFVFLDNAAPDKLFHTTDEAPISVPLAHIHYHYYRAKNPGDLVAVDDVGYLYAEFPTEEGLESALANLETGNMWFWELVGMCSEGMGVALWPEFRGSVTREMLDIEEY